MPGADVPVDAPLVRSLLREQHSDLASLPLAEAGEGWDNKLYRLGTDLVVRLPRRQAAAALIDHEQRWLPHLALRLPLPVPVPVRVGGPGPGFPWSWTIASWFAGRNAASAACSNAHETAIRLGGFLAALHQPAPSDAPSNPFRISLAGRADAFLARLQCIEPSVDSARAIVAWNSALAAPAYAAAPVWVHGDLHPGNLIVHDGVLSAVIDFGDLTAGDPAVDFAVVWMLFQPAERQVFREASGRIDDPTWSRARGWALTLGVAYLASSLDNPLMGRIGSATIAAVLADEAL